MKEFKITLISEIDKQSRQIKAPMAPGLAAQNVFEQQDMMLNAIVRIEQKFVNWLDKHIHNTLYERGSHSDVLVGLTIYKDNYAAVMFMDRGHEQIPMACFVKDEIYQNQGQNLHPLYTESNYSLKITDKELEYIQSYIWENIHPKVMKQIEEILATVN